MYDNERLYDVLTRHQVYVEGVKSWQAQEFNETLNKLDACLIALFASLHVKSLDELTKIALIRLIADLRVSQRKIYSEYTTKVIDDLKAFMEADLLVSKVVFATLELPEGNDEAPVSEADATGDLLEAIETKKKHILFPFPWLTGSADGNDKLWGKITNAPLPANGLYLLPFIDGFTASASNSIENMIRKGYALGLSPEETLNQIRGTKANNYRDGQLNRVGTQAAAVAATAIQHVTATVQAGVESAYHDRYILAAVLDSVTTAFCRKINGSIYQYGKGPLPPFHINCRTKAIPIKDEDEDIIDLVGQTWFAYLQRQPKAFRDDWVKMERAKASGKDFPGVKPLSTKDFKGKANIMLKR